MAYRVEYMPRPVPLSLLNRIQNYKRLVNAAAPGRTVSGYVVTDWQKALKARRFSIRSLEEWIVLFDLAIAADQNTLLESMRSANEIPNSRYMRGLVKVVKQGVTRDVHFAEEAQKIAHRILRTIPVTAAGIRSVSTGGSQTTTPRRTLRNRFRNIIRRR